MSYDNTCKYLAEKYPADFARWLLASDTTDIQVLKTELNLEPIRADSVTFLQMRFEKNLITQLFREEIMQESVIYQDILQKGLQQGLQQGEERGKKQEAIELILRLLTRRIGNVQAEIEQQIRSLAITQLEELAEALLDFNNQSDLVNYLGNISSSEEKAGE